MLAAWRRRKLERQARELMPDAAELAALCKRWPCLAAIDPANHSRLALRAGEILASKEFHGAGGLEPDRADCLPVAVLAAQVALDGGLALLAGFRTFILYRDAFEVEIDEVDDDGLVHRGRDLRAGEAWHGGPVVLSLADVAESGQGDGYHVVAHELAHQLDSLNGEPDGFPPLPPSIDPAEWSRCFTAAFERLNAMLARGLEPWIDPYAAESPAEFFAVCCEYRFDAPGLLARHEPAIHRLLGRLFRLSD
ncbi:MAG: zinc-dependent peptidase [Wenzhouxiangellaceae bacterium]|nr:zinc-dependent peptidase [Wenzhouxiangellaceae bacterium]